MPITLFAQDFDFQFQPEAFPVTIDGWQPFCPWAGGDSETAPEFCDIDTDGDLDLFVGSFWGTVSFFENFGTACEPDFNFVTREFAGIDIGGTVFYGRSDPAFVDIDGDGDYDVFTGDGLQCVHFWENIGTNTNPLFELISDSLEIIFPGYNKLSFVDIDADGDYDLFTGNFQGKICFMENVGNVDSFAFEEVTSYFDSIDVGDCASPCFVDIDSDNDYDLFIGDEDGHIWYFRNDGDSVQWDYTLVSSNFMNIDVGDYASPELGDVDGDGDYDLFVGREGTMSVSMGDIYYYENVGSPWNPQFQFITKNYLVLDIGLAPFIPKFVDINGDGLIDFLFPNGNSISYYSNIGNEENPAFELITDYFQNLSLNIYHPEFVDIDGDGDYDLLGGGAEIPGPPVVSLYINQGTPEEPDLVLYDENYITNPDFFVNAHPTCADIDADGDQDLFITDDHGYVYFYCNEGDPTRPDFTYVTNQWQGMYFPGTSGGWRALAFGDKDGDDDLDMMTKNVITGEDYGNLRYYRNEGTVYNPVMVLQDNLLLPGFYFYQGAPFLVDIDNDTDLDLFVGHSDGGVMFFSNLEVNSVSSHVSLQPSSFILNPCYPNPFNPATTISFTLNRALPVKLSVHNQLGQEVTTIINNQMSPGSYRFNWDALNFSSGVYLISLESNLGIQQTQKVILVK